MDKEQCIAMLRAKKRKLTAQQYSSIKELILYGDIKGAQEKLIMIERRHIQV